ncbi:MAG: glycosyltransferase family 4 protein [Actinomycetota bacterium]
MTTTTSIERLIIVVRADPVICGHSGEARNLAEAAIRRGVGDVRIVTWPLETLRRLPLKPYDAVLPYSPGITVERPKAVGDYKVPDGRFTSALSGRLVELFTDGVPSACMSLYLSPHAEVVADAMEVAKSLPRPVEVTTVAEAVGSDITGVVRACVESGNFGAAARVFRSYLSADRCVAVSAYTKDVIVEAAEAVDDHWGTHYAQACRERVTISYPAVDSAAFTDLDDVDIDDALAARGLERGNYVLFLSRVAAAKGVDDLIDGFARAGIDRSMQLVIAGSGPALDDMRHRAAVSGEADRIHFFDDVDDAEKPLLMAGAASFVLPSKPRPEFVETFGIALVEAMLSGGGPVITTETGGIPEAVGDTATVIPTGDPTALARALEHVLVEIDDSEREARVDKARAYALQFDRMAIFDNLFGAERTATI